MPISRSKKGGAPPVLSVLRSGNPMELPFRQSVGHLFAVFHVFDAHSADEPHLRICLLPVRACASCHRNRVLQSAEPKEAVVQWES
jgi:hypothetical protein